MSRAGSPAGRPRSGGGSRAPRPRPRRAAPARDRSGERPAGASRRPPSLHGNSSGAWRRRRRSSGRCHSPWRPGRFPAAGASKRIAPGPGPEQRGGRARVDRPPAGVAGAPARPAAAARAARAHGSRSASACAARARRGRRRDGDARAGPSQRVGQLVVGAPADRRWSRARRSARRAAWPPAISGDGAVRPARVAAP